MKKDVKKFMPYIIALGTGVLFAFLSLLAYVSLGVGINVYQLAYVSLFGGFAEVMAALFSVLMLGGNLVLIFVGLVGLLKELGLVKFEGKLGKLNYEKFTKIVFLVYISIVALLLLFVIITCVANGFAIGVGAILNTILQGLAFASLFVLPKLMDAQEQKAEKPAVEEPKQEAEAPVAEEPKAEEPSAE